MRHGGDDVATSSQSDRKRRGGGPPLGLVGLAALVALVGAYLGDCIPGLGAGGSPGAPPRESAPPPSSSLPEDDANEAPAKEFSIVVTGERCDAGSGAAPCPEVCAGLDASQAATSTVVIDATAGTHGAVEALRACLIEAGFTDLRVRSE